MITVSYEDFIASLPPKLRREVKAGNEVETIRYPVASIGLTHALGGGIGAGRISLIYGNHSSGKTLLSLQTIAKLQKQGLVCAYFDIESTYDDQFAKALGVDTTQLLVSQSRSAAKVTNEAVALIEAGLDLAVFDSVSALMPDVFLDSDQTVKDLEDRKQIGAQAKAVKGLVSGIHYANKKTAIILLSQTTTQIESTYIKQIPTGGKSLLFSASQIVKLTSSNTDAKQIKGLLNVGGSYIEQPIGRSVDATVEKNKLGRQSTIANYDFYYAGDQLGIDFIAEVLDLCVKFGIVKKDGAWFKFNDTKYQGRNGILSAIKRDSTLFDMLNKELDVIL